MNPPLLGASKDSPPPALTMDDGWDDGWESDCPKIASFMKDYECRRPEATEMARMQRVLLATENNLYAIKLKNADIEKASADARHEAAAQQRQQFAALHAAKKVSKVPMPLTHSFV